MRKQFTIMIVMAGLFSSYASQAQQSAGVGTTTTNGSDEIIIRKKGDKDSKVTVEFKDGQVTVNGKPLSEYNGDDVSVSRRRSVTIARPATPASPFRGGTYNFDYNQNRGQAFTYTTTANKALLGVMTEKDDNGAKITSVTKNSAAEKAGLKEGDVITKIDNTAIATPEDLSKAVGKYKPEDKATITYRRDKKEQKATATLEKRKDGGVFYSDGLNNPNFNFDMLTPGQDGNWNMVLRGNNLRLGIKAQDTEDGKGVKVLDVDDDSNAAKAGIKEGDVITDFDGDKVNSVSDLMEAAKDMKDKSSIKVKLSRDGKSQEVDIRVPKRLRTANL
ncbi:MAG: PDZ domain-containing protein [Williamsia sp.]|nr:PDZ domain-containing protein [Williamsia sp.]